MATLLFNSNIKVNNVRSIDIDPRFKPIALTMNKHYKLNGKFTAGTCNMLDFKNYNDYENLCFFLSRRSYRKFTVVVNRWTRKHLTNLNKLSFNSDSGEL